MKKRRVEIVVTDTDSRRSMYKDSVSFEIPIEENEEVEGKIFLHGYKRCCEQLDQRNFRGK